ISFDNLTISTVTNGFGPAAPAASTSVVMIGSLLTTLSRDGRGSRHGRDTSSCGGRCRRAWGRRRRCRRS
ncbi:MAG TPA: hypothetical protein VHS28_00240, partial [Chloroflexota bacterium]|nr:hypothetical protein [Chloroflexota bacterium]